MLGLLGRKVGMTQVFLEDGRRLPVTVIDVGNNVVIQKKTTQTKDGYNAIKLGFSLADKQEKSGMVRFRGMTKPDVGVFEKAGVEEPRRHVREFRIESEELEEFEVGQVLKAEDLFQEGNLVDVTGTSKGRGFTGVIKRHGYSMARATHGTHEFFRHGGAIGASAWPARVFKGTKMPGQHGNTKVTVQNVAVVEVIAEDGLILVKGGIPGANGSLVMVRQAVKRSRKASS